MPISADHVRPFAMPRSATIPDWPRLEDDILSHPPCRHGSSPIRLLLFGQAERLEMFRAGTNIIVVAQLDDQPWLGSQAAQSAKHGGPADVALARRPMTVGIAITVLEMYVG